ncbi:myosin heavy chain-like isoform X3 [Triticum urartu]|uniref:myosin heavy chain-like isoform X3 n=1 Tax=Triticum urartu TaxID=4572 RepID=UPI002043E2D8|nr:myosin heavy chain-like isoform X3 [Triticum urartu]
MGNIHQAGVKKDDHGGGDNQQLQVVSVLELQAGVVEDQPQPLGGWHAVEATSMLENCKTNSTATDGGTSSRIDILGPATEQNIPKPSDPPHPCPPPQSLPEGVQSVLKTSRVNRKCIGDGDGFTAYEERIAGDTNIRDPPKYKIRMKGIDAPELDMEYGMESKDELVRLIGGKRVSILVYGPDKYGRSLGDIYCDGVFIQEQMLKGGFAWHYKMCDKRPEFAKVEPQNQVNESSIALPLLIMKDMEDLGRKWKGSLENFVSENMKLHDQVQELKRDKKEAEERARKAEKEMESAVADNMKLNAQLQESEINKKEAEDRVLQLDFFSGSVAAVNMDLHNKIEVLENENKKAEDRAKEAESEMESVVAENRKLNDQLQVVEGQAVKLKYFCEKVAGVNIVLHRKLEGSEEKNKMSEEQAKETEKEMKTVLDDNVKLSGQIQKLNKLNKEITAFANNSKRKLQSVLAVNMDLDKKGEEGATLPDKGLETVGVENVKGKLQGISHKKSEQIAETPSATPTKDSGMKKPTVWRIKTTATTSSAPPPKGHYE